MQRRIGAECRRRQLLGKNGANILEIQIPRKDSLRQRHSLASSPPSLWSTLSYSSLRSSTSHRHTRPQALVLAREKNPMISVRAACVLDELRESNPQDSRQLEMRPGGGREEAGRRPGGGREETGRGRVTVCRQPSSWMSLFWHACR